MRWVIAAIVAMVAVTARGQTTAPAEAVDALVRQLSSDDWNARQKAQDALVELGEDALPQIKKHLADASDEEVRTRLEAAVRQIELAIENGPTRITLHVKNANINDVLADLSKQAKVTVGFDTGQSANATVTLDVDRQPFWLVMKEICRQTNVGPTPYYSSSSRGMISVQSNSNFAKLPATNWGCFYVAAISAQRSHRIDYSQPQNASASFHLQMAVYIDPKLRVMSGGNEFRIKEIVDDKGNAIVANSNMSMGGGSGAFYRREIYVPLKYDPALGKKIAKLSGSIDMTAQTKTQRWEIEAPLTVKDASKTVPMGKITIKEFKKTGEGSYQLRVTGLREPASVGSLQTICDYSFVQQSLQILDGNGRVYLQSGGGGSFSDTTFDYRYDFSRSGSNPATGEPVKLIWELPMECKPVSVPVELKDLELP